MVSSAFDKQIPKEHKEIKVKHDKELYYSC